MENGKEIHIGVDVSKATLDISDGSRFERIDNDKKAVTAFLREYKHCQIRVSAESTGPYHKVLAEVCHKLEIPFFLCDGKQVAYAKKPKGVTLRPINRTPNFFELSQQTMGLSHMFCRKN